MDNSPMGKLDLRDPKLEINILGTDEVKILKRHKDRIELYHPFVDYDQNPRLISYGIHYKYPNTQDLVVKQKYNILPNASGYISEFIEDIPPFRTMGIELYGFDPDQHEVVSTEHHKPYGPGYVESYSEIRTDKYGQSFIDITAGPNGSGDDEIYLVIKDKETGILSSLMIRFTSKSDNIVFSTTLEQMEDGTLWANLEVHSLSMASDGSVIKTNFNGVLNNLSLGPWIMIDETEKVVITDGKGRVKTQTTYDPYSPIVGMCCSNVTDMEGNKLPTMASVDEYAPYSIAHYNNDELVYTQPKGSMVRASLDRTMGSYKIIPGSFTINTRASVKSDINGGITLSTDKGYMDLMVDFDLEQPKYEDGYVVGTFIEQPLGIPFKAKIKEGPALPPSNLDIILSEANPVGDTWYDLDLNLTRDGVNLDFELLTPMYDYSYIIAPTEDPKRFKIAFARPSSATIYISFVVGEKMGDGYWITTTKRMGWSVQVGDKSLSTATGGVDYITIKEGVTETRDSFITLSTHHSNLETIIEDFGDVPLECSYQIHNNRVTVDMTTKPGRTLSRISFSAEYKGVRYMLGRQLVVNNQPRLCKEEISPFTVSDDGNTFKCTILFKKPLKANPDWNNPDDWAYTEGVLGHIKVTEPELPSTLIQFKQALEENKISITKSPSNNLAYELTIVRHKFSDYIKAGAEIHAMFIPADNNGYELEQLAFKIPVTV